MKNKIVVFLLAAVALIALPLFAQQFGHGWVRIMALALLYVLLALGLNIVVGYAGLLDLGYRRLLRASAPTCTRCWPRRT